MTVSLEALVLSRLQTQQADRLMAATPLELVGEQAGHSLGRYGKQQALIRSSRLVSPAGGGSSHQTAGMNG